MTQNEIIEMANDAELCQCIWIDDGGEEIASLVAFAKLVAAKEREACAKECEHTALRMGSEWMAQHCAEAIRARGEA
jgi:hypothetical protein